MTTDRPPAYDRFAAHYDRVMRPFERRLVARLRVAATRELPAGARLLEIGAGTGANFALYPPGSSVAATELSFEMLKLARAKSHAAPVALVQSPAERLPFADASFDAALSTLVLCSVRSISGTATVSAKQGGGRAAALARGSIS